MKKKFKILFIFLMLFCFSNVKAIPANDAFLDDSLYKCIIDNYNSSQNENKDYTYNIPFEELDKITKLDCSKYKDIEDLTGLTNLTNLTSLNLSGNTFLGGSLILNKISGTLRSNIKLPSNLSITDKRYTVKNSGIVKVQNGKVTPISYGRTTVVMEGKVSGYPIKEEYLVIVSSSNLSSNAKLSSLYLSKGEFQFDNTKSTFSTIVDNSVNSVSITATVLDKKAKFVSEYGPRNVKLDVGLNTLEVKVEAEDGTRKTYTILVTRSDGKNPNNKLINIELSVGKINFDSDVYTYTFGVESNVDSIDVKGVSESTLSKVTVTDIYGNTQENKITSKLKVGTNKITITVNSESNSKQDYQLIIIREDYDSLDNYLSELNIKNYNINFKRAVYNYDLTIGNENMLIITPKTEKTNATYNIIGNNNLNDGSKIVISVSDEEGSTREYTINIHKNGLDIIKLGIIGLEFLLIIIILIIIILRKNKDKPRPPKQNKNQVNVRKTLGNSNAIICNTCGTVNDITSKTCYVCGNIIK